MASTAPKPLVPVPPARGLGNNTSPGRGANKRSATTTNKKAQQQQQLQTDVPDYVRLAEAQGRALERWQKQQRQWDHVANQTAQAAHKPEGAAASLAASTHTFREKVEEMGKIDVAVPPAARSHASNSWEMSLRNGASATRYEPVGSSFPYPLYCPIRAPDQVSSENPAFMHVIYPPGQQQQQQQQPPPLASSKRTVMESGFFKERQQEFAGQISKKFSHFAEREYFEVQGGPAPRTAERIDEDDPAAMPSAPVQFFPTSSKEGGMDGMGSVGGQGGTHAITIRNLIAQQQQQGGEKSVSTAAGIRPFEQQQQQQKSDHQSKNISAPGSPATVGPMLVLSTNNLSFTTNSAQEIKQAIVTLENTGSTAIFYNWAPLPSAPSLLVPGSIGGSDINIGNVPPSASSSSPVPNAPPTPPPGGPAATNTAVAAPTPSTQMASPFSLANPVTGSILPGAHKMFCFSFRAPAPGVFVQHMELVTVPSGRERIVVTLRGVALEADANVVSCESIEQKLRAMAAETMASEIVRGDIVHNKVENVFAVSDAAQAVRQRESELEAERTAHLALREERRAKWAAANAALSFDLERAAQVAAAAASAAAAEAAAGETPRKGGGGGGHGKQGADQPSREQQLADQAAAAAAAASDSEQQPTPMPFNEPAYAALELVRSRCNEFRDEFETSLAPPKKTKAQLAAIAAAEKEAASGKKRDGAGAAATPRGRRGDDEDAEPPPDRVVQLVGDMPQEWTGSLRGIYEDVNTLRTAKTRHAAVDAVAAVHRALSALQEHNKNSNNNDDDFFFGSDTAPLSNLVWLSAGRTWLGNAMDKFERAATLAGARVDGRATCVSKGINMFGAPAKKGGGGGAADKTATAPAHALGADLNAMAASVKPGRGADKSVAAPAPAASSASKPSEETQAEIGALMEQSMKHLLLHAVEGMISTHDNDMGAIETATVLPLSALIADDAERVINARDADAEPVLDLNSKKRK